MGNLFMKHAVGLMLVDITSPIIWSNFFHSNTPITCKLDKLNLHKQEENIWLNRSCFNKLETRSKLTWEKVEDLKMEHCYIAPDYASEVQLFQVSLFSVNSLNAFYSSPFILLLDTHPHKKIFITYC